MWKILLSKSSIMAQRVILNIKTEHKNLPLVQGGRGLGASELGGLRA
jgi:hypothetical protein